MECLGRYTFLVMTSVILSGGMKMRDEHGMLREVYISCHDFCHTFRWCENEGRKWRPKWRHNLCKIVPGAFRDLEPVSRAMRFSEALGGVLGTPGTSKIVLPLQCGHNFCLNRRPRRGGPNRPHSGPKSRPKASPEVCRWGVKPNLTRLRFRCQFST